MNKGTTKKDAELYWGEYLHKKIDSGYKFRTQDNIISIFTTIIKIILYFGGSILFYGLVYIIFSNLFESYFNSATWLISIFITLGILVFFFLSTHKIYILLYQLFTGWELVSSADSRRFELSEDFIKNIEKIENKDIIKSIDSSIKNYNSIQHNLTTFSFFDEQKYRYMIKNIIKVAKWGHSSDERRYLIGNIAFTNLDRQIYRKKLL